MSEFVDHYEVLGVPPTATDDEIRRAYKARLTTVHPDKSDAADANAATQRVVEAKKVLLDAKQRAAFDARRSAHVEEERRAAMRASINAARAKAVKATTTTPRTSVPARAAARSATAPRDRSAGSGSFWGLLFGLGVAAAAAASTANGWDSDAGRYRGGDGRFRRGRWD